MALAKDGKWRDAEKVFKKLLNQDQKLASAHYGLGFVYFRQEPPQLQDARKHLRSAVRNHPSSVDAWLLLGELEEQFWPEAAVEVYADALQAIPHNQSLYRKFFDLALLQGRRDLILSTLNHLTQAMPDNRELLFDLAAAFHYFEDYDAAHTSAERLRKEFPDFSRCRTFLLLAKLHFDQNQDAEGLDYYMSAQNTIADSLDAMAFAHDLYYIMEDDEYAELTSTPEDQLWKFYLGFWRRRDPYLATQENERIPEHYRRISYARKHYRKFAERTKESEWLYESDNPYLRFYTNGEKFLRRAFLPQALSHHRDIDDLGLVYTRHGEPDQTATSRFLRPTYIDTTMWVEFHNLINILPVADARSSEGFIDAPMNISLQYFATADRPEMIFHFKKYGAEAGWIIESLPTVLDGREMLDSKYFQLGIQLFKRFRNEIALEDLSKSFAERARDDLETGMQTESSGFTIEAEPMKFPFQFLAFKGARGKELIEYYYVLSGKELDLKMSNGQKKLSTEKFIGFWDTEMNEVLRYQQPTLRSVNMAVEDWQNQAVIDVVTLDVAPGTYNFEVQLKDEVSRKLGLYRGKYVVPDFSSAHLWLSSILLSSEIGPASETSPFKRGDIAFLPHMFSSFSESEQAGLYFEIYNLKLDANGRSDFQVQCTLQKFGADDPSVGRQVSGFFKNLFGGDEGVVGTSYNYNGSSRDERIYMNFDLVGEDEGHYELVVQVTDRKSTQVTTGSVDLYIR